MNDIPFCLAPMLAANPTWGGGPDTVLPIKPGPRTSARPNSAPEQHYTSGRNASNLAPAMDDRHHRRAEQRYRAPHNHTQGWLQGAAPVENAAHGVPLPHATAGVLGRRRRELGSTTLWRQRCVRSKPHIVVSMGVSTGLRISSCHKDCSCRLAFCRGRSRPTRQRAEPGPSPPREQREINLLAI